MLEFGLNYFMLEVLFEKIHQLLTFVTPYTGHSVFPFPGVKVLGRLNLSTTPANCVYFEK